VSVSSNATSVAVSSAVDCSRYFMCNPQVGSGTYAGVYPTTCPAGCKKGTDQKSVCDTNETPKRSGQLYNCIAQ
jgi:hypothetical protein